MGCFDEDALAACTSKGGFVSCPNEMLNGVGNNGAGDEYQLLVGILPHGRR